MRFSLQPVHATGRYFYLSLVEILQREFGYPKVYSESSLLLLLGLCWLTWALAVNQLDRLTLGLMIIGLSSPCVHTLSQEFVQAVVMHARDNG